MGIKDFYSFSSKFLASTLQVEPVYIAEYSNEEKQNIILNLSKGNYKNIVFPFLFRQKYGNKLYDIIDTGTVSLYLISFKIKSILEKNLLTGYEIFTIRVFDKKGVEISGYYGLSITGKCGKIDYNKSEIIQKEAEGSRRAHKVYKGLHIGLDKWDNTDFFLPDGTSYIIISAKAANILKKEKLSNLVIENLSEIEIDELSLPFDFGNENYINN